MSILLTYARFGSVKINYPGPVPAVGEVGHVVAVLEDPTQGTPDHDCVVLLVIQDLLFEQF